uniref:(northern house mosquito) hypothetical protein n=1 Tax=Culex pipiens TaxID=7175 RepID=A0A8D8K6F6_CULPI
MLVLPPFEPPLPPPPTGVMVISLFDLDKLSPVLACRLANAPDVTVAACCWAAAAAAAEFIRSGAVRSRASVGENEVKPGPEVAVVAGFGRDADLVRMPWSNELLVELAAWD